MRCYDFTVGIPTINQYDKLKDRLALYCMDMPEIPFIIIDNGKQGIDISELPHPWQFNVIQNPVNLGVAGSWNVICHMAFSHCDNVLLINDDVFLGVNQWEIQDIIDEHESDFDPYFIMGEKGLTGFIIHSDLYRQVGDFDAEFYPAYFEDNDYIERMKRAGLKPIIEPRLTPKVFEGSRSIAKDPTLNDNFNRNKERFRAKWGYVPDEENV